MIRFLVENWMMGEGLHLKGCELLVFAYAYSYHRKGKMLFVSEGNLGEMIDYSRRSVGTALDKLCEKQLLIRSEEKHPEYQTYTYSINDEKVRRFVTPGCEETSQGDAKKVPTQIGSNVTSPCNLFSHNNEKDNNIDNSINIKSKTYGNHKIRSIDAGSREEFEGGNVL